VINFLRDMVKQTECLSKQQRLSLRLVSCEEI